MSSTVNIEDIQGIWDKLPKSAKKVFQILHNLDKKHNGKVFPGIDRLIELSGFAKRTILYSLGRLRKLGWVSHERRPYQTNLYFISEILRSLNFTYSRVKIAHDLRHINYITDSLSFSVHKESPSAPPPPSAVSASPNVPINQEKEKEKKRLWFFGLPEWLQIKAMWHNFDINKFGWVLKKLSECEMAKLKDDILWFIRQKKVKSPEKLVFSMAIKIYQARKRLA